MTESTICVRQSDLLEFADKLRADITQRLQPALDSATADIEAAAAYPALGASDLNPQARAVGVEIDRKLHQAQEHLQGMIDGLSFMAEFAQSLSAAFVDVDDDNGEDIANLGDYATVARQALEDAAPVPRSVSI